MSTRYHVAVVGADGLVGAEMVRILAERDFPVEDLRLLAPDASGGETIEFDGEECDVHELTAEAFAGVDIAFFCTDEEHGRGFAPAAAAAGAVCIDASGAWSREPDVPLVVPEVNPDDLALFRNRGIVASPGCAAIQLALPLKALGGAEALRRVVVSTFQPVSDGGEGGIDELRKQVGELLNGRPPRCRVFPEQIGFNCIPQVGPFDADGGTAVETRTAGEVGRILGTGGALVTVTAVQVPVFYGQCQAVNVEAAGRIAPERARELFAAFPGLEVVDDVEGRRFPMPMTAAGGDVIQIGRIRADETSETGLNFWAAGDNLRKGAAINMVQIGELLVARHL